MRRKDREVKEPEKILNIMESCEVCRIGFADAKGIYIVPLNFGFTNDKGKITLYFHGAAEGRKAENIRKNPYVGFELDIPLGIKTGETACGFSYRYQSIIGTGKAEMISDPEEKIFALQAIMTKYTKSSDQTFDKSVLMRTALFKITVKELSCKEHI